MVRLTDSSITSSVGNETKTDTFGGNITIDPQFVILQNSQILAQAFAGAGGNITIVSNVFLADPSSLVDASSQLGISGTVNILSPVQNIGGELTALTQEFSSAAALLAQQCAARAADGKFSTFVVAAREGLPAEPGGFLASPSLTSELLGSRLSGRDPQTQLSAITGLFPKYDARPIQLARFGDSCHR
jgi:large exoprotein involved in heme utilization and adhesion